MKIKIGVMGSAAAAASSITAQAIALGQALAGRDVLLLTGATTGLVYQVGKTAKDAGVFHTGISPASSQSEHVERYKLPLDGCDLLIFTGFGLKGRNVVLVRSCDIAIFVAGSMGSLNEFTIAYDEGKIIGCLTGTGGVADEAVYLQEKFSKETTSRVIADADPVRLVDACMRELKAVGTVR
ncbi:MAG: hypothetical protein ABI967_07245 [bacterium]